MEEKKSKVSITFRYIFLVLYILCVCVIFGLSLQDGQKSSDLSGGVGDGIAGIIDGAQDIIDGIGGGGHDSGGEPSGGSGDESGGESGGEEVAPKPEKPHHSIVETLKEKGHDFYLIVRKLFGHFGAFVVLGILSCIVYLTFIKKKWVSVASLVGSGIIVAGVSELLQLIPEGRCCTFKDFLIDSSGYMLAICIGLVIWLIKILKDSKKNKLELDS